MSEFKINCSNCDGQVVFPKEMAWQEITCPHCNQTILLAVPHKLAIWAVGGILLLVCLASAGMMAIFLLRGHSKPPVIAESLWKKDARSLQQVPPVLIIRPTHFPGQGGGVGTESGRLMQLDASIRTLVSVAYSFDWTQIIMPADLPTEHYDLMLTLPDNPKEKLKMELARKFGIVAQVETRTTEVLLLEVGSAPELKLKTGSNSGLLRHASITSGTNGITIHNLGILSLVPYLEDVLNKPVLDRTELKDVYDLQFKIPSPAGELAEETVQHAVWEQLGLELVATNMPMAMLVVEKAR